MATIFDVRKKYTLRQRFEGWYFSHQELCAVAIGVLVLAAVYFSLLFVVEVSGPDYESWVEAEGTVIVVSREFVRRGQGLNGAVYTRYNVDIEYDVSRRVVEASRTLVTRMPKSALKEGNVVKLRYHPGTPTDFRFEFEIRPKKAGSLRREPAG